MEKKKSLLHKLKAGYARGKKLHEARSINRQFNQDTSKVYAHFRELCSEDKERPKYQSTSSNHSGCDSEERFENIEDASNFWIELWETRGTENMEAEWLSKIKKAIARKVPVPSGGSWRLQCSEAVKCLLKKKNWSAPGPDHFVDYWWKCMHVLHEGITKAFFAISESTEEYPTWFSEGKTRLIPKPGEFSSEHQPPITCLNNIYKWFTSCLQTPMDNHLSEFDLMENGQRGARLGCNGTSDNLMIDRMVTLDCHRGK